MSNNKYSLVSFSVFNSKFAISEDEVRLLSFNQMYTTPEVLHIYYNVI